MCVFVNQDETRTTAASFLAWIEGPKDGWIEDVLADFELKYDELSDEERAMFADRPLYFSKCLPEEHRLIFLEPLCKRGRLEATWGRVQERVREFAGAARYVKQGLLRERSAPDRSAPPVITTPPTGGNTAGGSTSPLPRHPPSYSSPGPAMVPGYLPATRTEDTIDQLRRQMETLTIKMSRLPLRHRRVPRSSSGR